MPGATIRKPREKVLLFGWRTALTVCQAISIAMTVVLPAPVASLSARRSSSGLACSLAPLMWVQNFSAALAQLGRDLGQPDGGLDRLDLAEERPDAVKRMVPPVLEQARRFRRDQPVVGIGQLAPAFDVGADLVDDRGRVVLLLLGRKIVAGVEHHLGLRLAAPLLRLRDRRDQVRAAADVEDPVGGLAVLVQLPVAAGIVIGRVQDRTLEELLGHASA